MIHRDVAVNQLHYIFVTRKQEDSFSFVRVNRHVCKLTSRFRISSMDWELGILLGQLTQIWGVVIVSCGEQISVVFRDEISTYTHFQFTSRSS